MHKSLGNAVSPDEVIREYGADMLRLWVASADYTQDMRISKDIMKQLSQAYLKIRNTAATCWATCATSTPTTTWCRVERMMDLDRFALASFNELVKTCRAAYDKYEFHARLPRRVQLLRGGYVQLLPGYQSRTGSTAGARPSAAPPRPPSIISWTA